MDAVVCRREIFCSPSPASDRGFTGIGKPPDGRLRKFLPLDNPAEQPRRCRSRLHRAEFCIRPGFLAVFMHTAEAARRRNRFLAPAFIRVTERTVPVGVTGAPSCRHPAFMRDRAHCTGQLPPGRADFLQSLRKSGSPFREISAMDSDPFQSSSPSNTNAAGPVMSTRSAV